MSSLRLRCAKTYEGTLTNVKSAKYLTKLDANSGFHLSPLDEFSQLLWCFITPWDYCYKHLPLGVPSPLAHFQKCITAFLISCEGSYWWYAHHLWWHARRIRQPTTRCHSHTPSHQCRHHPQSQEVQFRSNHGPLLYTAIQSEAYSVSSKKIFSYGIQSRQASQRTNAPGAISFCFSNSSSNKSFSVVVSRISSTSLQGTVIARKNQYASVEHQQARPFLCQHWHHLKWAPFFLPWRKGSS